MRTFTEYLARAQSLYDAGFTSESNRKDALDLLNRAHDATQEEVHGALLRAGDDERRTDAWQRLYYGWPALHVWKPKHAEMFGARFPKAVGQANAAANLRDFVKAAAIAPKAPSAKKAARDAKTMTCQICGRPIFAETGVIAHHGYRRPGTGWQTASCFGARKLPFEASRDALGAYVAGLARMLKAQRLDRVAVANEKQPVVVHYTTHKVDADGKTVYYRGRTVDAHHSFPVTAATFRREHDLHPAYFSRRPGVSFLDLLEADLRDRARAIKENADYLAQQQARYDAWRLTHLRADGKWRAI